MERSGKALEGLSPTDGRSAVKDDSVRDKAMDRLVAGKLRAQLKAPGEPCASAEMLAAYVERALAPKERLNLETHLASCLRCQEQVAELVRLSEAEEPAAAIAPVAGAPRRFSYFRLAWAAPVFVALVVAGFWYTGEFRSNLKLQEPAAKSPAKPAALEQARNAPATREARGGAASSVAGITGESAKLPSEEKKIKKTERASPFASLGTGAAAQARPSAGPASAEGGSAATVDRAAGAAAGIGGGVGGAIATPRERARLAEAVPPASRNVESEAAPVEDHLTTAAKSLPAPPAAPSAAGEKKEETKDLVRQEGAARDEAASGAGRSAAEAAASVPADKAAGKESRKGEAAQKKKEPMHMMSSLGLAPLNEPAEGGHMSAGAERSAPPLAQGAVRKSAPRSDAGQWRVGTHGLIEKADAQGKWVAQASGVDVDLYAIAFATATAGWAVGKSGTVLRTTDGGATWKKIPLPTEEDLIRVRADDEFSAHVVTRGGRALSTTDGGKTWTVLRLE